jgi:hypothetical protein
MKHQRVRAAAIAAATLGLAAGATLATAGGAQAAARPAVASSWNCQSLSPLISGRVVGLVCSGHGTGSGWLGLGGSPVYLCYNTPSPDPSGVGYDVNGTNCVTE